MELCVACGKDCEITEFDPKNWFRIDCKTYGAFEIHRVAINRVKASDHEMNLLLLRLKTPRDGKKLLKVSYAFAGEFPTLKFED